MSATLTVGTVCDCHPATVCARDTLQQAERLLTNSHTAAIVVIASAVPRPTVIGIITYPDVLNALSLGNDLERVRVVEVLDRDTIVLHEEEDIDAAILKLRCRGARYAPVTGPGGTLRGIVSMDRLLTSRKDIDAYLTHSYD